MQVSKDMRTFIGLNPTGDLGPFTIYTSRRAGSVWFIKAPPLSPPTIHQIHQRNRFRLAALAWKALPKETRHDWHNACRRAGLYLNGYNLWIYWILRRNRTAIATIERLSHVTLLPEGNGPTL